MKIGKGLLKQVEEDNLGTKELYSEDTYRDVAQLYEIAIRKYTNKSIWFLPPPLSEARRKQRYEQIKKFIDICIEFEISFEVVMNEQIKVLAKFIKEKNMPMKYPPFNMLISENARKRMGYLKSDIARRYTGKARIKETFKVSSLDIEKSLRSSMEQVYIRFIMLANATIDFGKQEADQEIEIMARAKLISNVYVYSSPSNNASVFLKKMSEDVSQRLSKQQKEEVGRIKKGLMNEFEDKEILKYV